MENKNAKLKKKSRTMLSKAKTNCVKHIDEQLFYSSNRRKMSTFKMCHLMNIHSFKCCSTLHCTRNSSNDKLKLNFQRNQWYSNIWLFILMHFVPEKRVTCPKYLRNWLKWMNEGKKRFEKKMCCIHFRFFVLASAHQKCIVWENLFKFACQNMSDSWWQMGTKPSYRTHDRHKSTVIRARWSDEDWSKTSVNYSYNKIAFCAHVHNVWQNTRAVLAMAWLLLKLQHISVVFI